jgi:hypothetical protein
MDYILFLNNAGRINFFIVRNRNRNRANSNIFLVDFYLSNLG